MKTGTITAKMIAKSLDRKFILSIQGLKKEVRAKHLRILFDALILRVTEELCKGNKVILPNFGTFEKHELKYSKVYDFQRSVWMRDYPITRISFKTSENLKRKWNLGRSKPETPRASDHREIQPQL